MAIAHVQTVNGTTATTTVSAAPTLTAANAVVATIIGSFVASTYTQTAGPTLTLATNGDFLGYHFRHFYALNVTGGATTFTFETDVADSTTLFISEFSGIATADALDQTNAGLVDNSTTHSTGNITITAADEVLVAALHIDGAGATNINDVAPTNSFIVPANGEVDSSGAVMQGSIAYFIANATGTYSTTFSQNAPSDGRALILSLKAPAVAANTGVASPFFRIKPLRWG